MGAGRAKPSRPSVNLLPVFKTLLNTSPVSFDSAAYLQYIRAYKPIIMDSGAFGRALVTAAFSGTPFDAPEPEAPAFHAASPFSAAPTHEPARASAPTEGVVYVEATRLLPEPCSICLEPIKPQEQMGIIKACLGNGAQHYWHERCIAPWWSINRSCPNCRTPAA